MSGGNYVIVSRAPDLDYKTDYVVLPKNYGSRQYYQRKDVSAIIDTVESNLNALNEKLIL